MLTNKQTFSDVVILLALEGLNHNMYVFSVFTEVLWCKMIQLLSNKTMPHFQLLPMAEEDQSYLRIRGVPPLH